MILLIKITNCCGINFGGKSDTASKYVTNTFNCLALVLEMPFIDHNNQPNSNTGWSATRSLNLGADILKPIEQFL
jgi:hypothetical protein